MEADAGKLVTAEVSESPCFVGGDTTSGLFTTLLYERSQRRVRGDIVEKAMPPRRKRGRDSVPEPAGKLVKRKRDPGADVPDSPITSQVKHVALLRGINVGTAKQVPMPTLALCFEQLGYRNVRTLLRSGNVVFEADTETLVPDAGARLEAAVLAATGVQASVLLISGRRFAAIAEGNPLLEVATDGSKSFVSFLSGSGGVPRAIECPDASELAPEVLRVGEGAVYQWMPAGFVKTGVPKAFWKQLDGPVTARNWNTVNKILALLV